MVFYVIGLGFVGNQSRIRGEGGKQFVIVDRLEKALCTDGRCAVKWYRELVGVYGDAVRQLEIKK